MSISDFSFDDGDRSLTSNTKRLKFKNGETVRVSFAWFPKGDDDNYDLSSNPKFRGAMVLAMLLQIHLRLQVSQVQLLKCLLQQW